MIAEALSSSERGEELDSTTQSVKKPPARRSNWRIFILALAVVCFNAFGNLSLAVGMKRFSQSLGINPVGYLHAMASPFVAVGIGLLILWMLTRMTLMSWADLSFVLPLTGFGYVMAAVLGRVFLDESISQRQWLGVILISVGIGFVGTTRARTGHSAQDPV